MRNLILSISLSFITWHANAWVTCTMNNGAYQYFSPSTTSVGKDTEAGDLIGQWQTSTDSSTYTCSVPAASVGETVSIGVRGYSPYAVWGSTTVDGQTYNIYHSAVKLGLGYIARWRYIVDGEASDWNPLVVAAGVYQAPSSLMTANTESPDSSWSIATEVQIHLVKTSNDLTAGVVAAFDPVYLQLYQEYNGAYTAALIRLVQSSLGNFIIDTTGGTCTTPDVNVDLGNIFKSEFTGVGSTSAYTDFSLSFSGCPSGLSSISYIFTPTTEIVDNNLGLFAMDSSSSSTGVAFQLLNNSATPISFDATYILSDYDSSLSDASYTINMGARLYQTSSTVTSGTVSGAVTFTLIYK